MFGKIILVGFAFAVSVNFNAAAKDMVPIDTVSVMGDAAALFYKLYELI